MNVRRARGVLAAALLCTCLAARAHNFHFGITEIGHNAGTGAIEVVHTYMADDLEALLADLYQRRIDLSEPDDEALLRNYVEKQFYLLAADKSRLPLRWIGLTVGIGGVVIYQEIAATPLARAARIHDAVISDFIADQINTVNIGRGAARRTLSFSRQSVEQDLP